MATRDEERSIKHLYERGLDHNEYPSSVISFSYGYGCVFMLYDFAGRITGCQYYNPDGDKKKGGMDGRYCSHIINGNQGVAFWGLERYTPGKPVFVVEGVFDAVAVHRLGYSCFAVLGTRVKQVANIFACLPAPVIAIEDGDGKTGLAKHCDYSIRLPAEHDPDSIGASELLGLIKSKLDEINRG